MITQCSIKSGSEFLMAQQVVNVLDSYFPGWEWMASVDGGVLYIKNNTLSSKWGMQQRADTADKRSVLAAGDEFLRRFNMPNRYDEALVATAERDFTGSIVSEKWTPDRKYYNKAERRWKA